MQSGSPKGQWRKYSVMRWWFGENKFAKREEQKRLRKKKMN
jgi:hypothetical protein